MTPLSFTSLTLPEFCTNYSPCSSYPSITLPLLHLCTDVAKQSCTSRASRSPFCTFVHSRKRCPFCFLLPSIQISEWHSLRYRAVVSNQMGWTLWSSISTILSLVKVTFPPQITFIFSPLLALMPELPLVSAISFKCLLRQTSFVKRLPSTHAAS